MPIPNQKACLIGLITTVFFLLCGYLIITDHTMFPELLQGLNYNNSKLEFSESSVTVTTNSVMNRTNIKTIPYITTTNGNEHNKIMQNTMMTTVTSSSYSSTERSITTIRTETENTDYVVNNPGCKIPKLDPFHPSVKKFIEHLPDLTCPGSSLIVAEDNTLQITKSKVSDSNECFMQPIIRKTEDESELGNSVRFENSVMNVTSEHVQVECKLGSKTVYRNFYPFVLRKEGVERRIQNYTQNQNSQTPKQFKLLLLGLDSVSKNQFLRHMLKTHDFMKEKLTYAEIHGYNKIGKNTYSNLVPFFTGKLESEIPDTSAQPADVLPFIWKEFMENGYRTQFSEDLPQGSIFNYARKGFTEPPVDYYLRPWSLSVEPYIKKWKTGCMNERVEASVILKYMEDFFELFSKDPLFAFTFLTRMSHDYINQLSYHDKPIRDFMERLYLKGHFNNTFMFFFGDHGFRFGDIRSTYVGRMEGRLPFMFIIVPPWFPKKYPQMYKNLKTNERNLVSPLDIYATLKDLLHFDGKGTGDEGRGRSISLLKYSIPENRTCEEAAILNQFCACVKSEAISLDDGRVKSSAVEIVRKINSITEAHRTKCAELSLVSILSASKQEVGLGEDSSHDGHTNFLITLKVAPSEGVFEGSVWYNGKSTYSADNSVERINLYRNQSACIDQNVLKPYCYCSG